MTLWRDGLGDTRNQPRGGYFRGFLAASVVSSVSFIAIATAFPSNTIIQSQTPVAVAAVQPAAERLIPVETETDSFASTSLTGIKAPAIDSPEVNGGTALASATPQSPSFPTASQPVALNASPSTTEIAVANTESTERPTAGLTLQTASIAQPITDTSTTTAIEPTVNVAAVATTQPTLPPIPAVAQNGAFAQNAQVFSDSQTRPLVSIILKVENIDQVRASYSLAASVTLAIDVNNPEAANIAAAYRKVGGESLLLLPEANALPVGESPATIAANLNRYLTDDLQVIGMIDPTGNAVSNDDLMIHSVLSALATSGHAIVAPQTHNVIGTATNVGIPAAAFAEQPNIDGMPAISASKIDQSVASIGSDDAVVIYGIANNATIITLSNWLASSTASSVMMGPVSAAIQRF